jgi:hypothetical protein
MAWRAAAVLGLVLDSGTGAVVVAVVVVGLFEVPTAGL